MTAVVVGTARGVVRLPGGTTAYEDSRIVSLFPDGDTPWVLTDQRTVVHGAERWKIPGDERLHWITPWDGGALIGAGRATLLRLDPVSGAVTRDPDFDDAPGRDDWYTPWGGPPDVRSISIGTDGTIYVNVHVGGVVRRHPGGHWADTMDIDADVHQVAAHPEQPELVAAATARGLAVSRDGADTWSFHRDSLHASYCRAVAWSGDTLLLSASRSNRGQQAAVYRTDDLGESFARVDAGLPEWFSTNVNTGCLVASVDTVVIGDERGTVYASEDGGRTFETAADGLAAIVCVALV